VAVVTPRVTIEQASATVSALRAVTPALTVDAAYALCMALVGGVQIADGRRIVILEESKQ
jgi:hypothetical protein